MISVEDLQQRPYVRLLIPFIAGIILQLYIPVTEKWIVVLFLLSVGILISVYTWQKVSPIYQYRWLFGLALNLFLLSSGCSILSLHKHRSNFTYFDSGINQVIAVVTELPVEKPKTYKTVLNVRRINSVEGWVKTRGKTIAYFQKDSLARNLQIGDQLAVLGRFQKIRFQNNPLEFNYRDYLLRHNIYCQMYLQPANWKEYYSVP